MYLLEQLNLVLTIQVLVFIVAALLFAALTMWLSTGFSASQRRLQALQKQEHKAGDQYQEGSFTVHWMEPIANLILPEDNWKHSRLKKRLITAGYRTQRARYVFLVSKVIMAFVPSLLVVFPLLLLGFIEATQQESVLIVAAAAVIGFFMPDLYLHHKCQERQQILQESFPDALDLLVVCVEAGLSLDAAVQRVAKELMLSHPELGEEMSLVSLELRAGKSRDEALRSLADRTGLDDVKSLTSILIQADHFGTSVAEALREHANEMRTVRIQIAREKAAKLPVKLTFPILLFIFPAIFLVILGPAAIRIFTVLLNHGG